MKTSNLCLKGVVTLISTDLELVHTITQKELRRIGNNNLPISIEIIMLSGLKDSKAYIVLYDLDFDITA